MRLLAPITLLLVILGLTTGTLRLWDLTGIELLPAGRYILGVALVSGLLSLAFFARDRRPPSREELADPRVWALGLVALFISDWICRPYAFFQGPTIRGELILGALCSYALFKGRWRGLLVFLPVASSILLFHTFISVSKGALLISDDHAMFLFRLRLLKQNFPFIPFWSPLWNAGLDARDFFATGALNAFFLASPLLYIFDVERVYNVVVALFLWVLTPACTYAGARLVRFTRLESAAAATLVMCTGLTWYRWALTYGTMGFVVSSALLPLVTGLSVRFVSEEEPRTRDLALLVTTVTLMLLWSLSGVALIPIAAVAVPYAIRILRSRKHLLTIVLIVAINLPWMLMLWKVSSVGRFLNSDTTTVAAHHNVEAASISQPVSAADNPEIPQGSTFRHKKGELSIRKSIDAWQESAGSLNPLIVILAIPSLVSLSGLTRRTFGLLTGWLVLLGTVGVSLKPQLELDRMIVMGAVVACIPIGRFIIDLFRNARLGHSYAVASSLVGAFVLIGPLAVSSILHNRSFDHFNFAEPVVRELGDAIKQHARGGRAVFTGCVMHELSGGHLAPLALWSETPLVASSYAHNIWKYEQPIPKSYLSRQEEGIREFFDHMNATLVLAHEPENRKYLTSHPELYAERWRGGRFTLFERLGYDSSYVLEGQVSALSQNDNSVTLVPESDRVILKFRYFPFLTTAEQSCSILPHRVAPEIEFIELNNCPPGKQVTIQSVGSLDRLLK
jgi:hypothetical protein